MGHPSIYAHEYTPDCHDGEGGRDVCFPGPLVSYVAGLFRRASEYVDKGSSLSGTKPTTVALVVVHQLGDRRCRPICPRGQASIFAAVRESGSGQIAGTAALREMGGSWGDRTPQEPKLTRSSDSRPLMDRFLAHRIDPLRRHVCPPLEVIFCDGGAPRGEQRRIGGRQDCRSVLLRETSDFPQQSQFRATATSAMRPLRRTSSASTCSVRAERICDPRLRSIGRRRCFTCRLSLCRLRCRSFELQQPIRILVAELGRVGRRKRDAIEKLAALRIRRVGVIDREHDAIDAEG